MANQRKPAEPVNKPDRSTGNPGTRDPQPTNKPQNPRQKRKK